MADTQHPEPTDAELDELRQANGGKLNFVTLSEFRTIARAVLAKWGTPPAEQAATKTEAFEQASRLALETLERASDSGFSVECDESIVALRAGEAAKELQLARETARLRVALKEIQEVIAWALEQKT